MPPKSCIESSFLDPVQNVIAIVANGNMIQLFVNNTLVDSITDTAFSQGQIGLIADSYNSPTEVAFANAKVWTL